MLPKYNSSRNLVKSERVSLPILINPLSPRCNDNSLSSRYRSNPLSPDKGQRSYETTKFANQMKKSTSQRVLPCVKLQKFAQPLQSQK